MKGKTMTIGIIVFTLLVVAVIAWLMLATFEKDAKGSVMAAWPEEAMHEGFIR